MWNQKDTVKALKDGRRWKKACPTSWQGHRRVRYADCKGSYKCDQTKCPFIIQYGVTNTTQFTKRKNGSELFCKGCGKKGTFVPCHARRYISYREQSVKVYHCGKHTCPVIKSKAKNKEYVQKLLNDNPKIKPAELQSACILSAFRQQKDWKNIEKDVEATLDRDWIANEKKKMKRDTEPAGQNFEAVVTFKTFCDQKDEFYVYKANDRRGNPDKPSFVFKTSREKAKIAINMDKDREHFLNNEFCYFDGKFRRCRGFVTLTASVYHSLLRKQIPLAVMEAEKEDTENVALFWTLFNEVLQKVSGRDDAIFNPTGWCTDMAGANMAGICKVFGLNAKYRIKSCEFHFKDHRNKKAQKLDPESAEVFKTLCDELLESLTEKRYEATKKKFDEFISAKEERLFLENWLSWWHNRRGFIFRAFAPSNAPNMNQAEVIHAGWAHRDNSTNMTLLDVCHADVRDSIMLDVELKAFAAGTSTGGNGPSYLKRRQKAHAREVGEAKRLGAELLTHAKDDESGRQIDPNSSCHPKGKKKRRKISNTKVTDVTTVTSNIPSFNQIFTPTNATPVVFPTRNSSFMANQIPSYVSMPQPRLIPHTPNLSNYTSTPFPINNSTPTTSTWQQFEQSLSCFPFSPIHRSQLENQQSINLGNEWHSGKSPHPYEIVLLPSIVKKCYGCGSNFAEKYRSEPYNIIVKHVDRRVIKKCEQTGKLLYSYDFSNTYYHLDSFHLRRKNPVFTGHVLISRDLYTSLKPRQREILNECEGIYVNVS